MNARFLPELRPAIGLSILFGAFAFNIYQQLAPVDLDRINEQEKISWEEVQRKSEEFLREAETKPVERPSQIQEHQPDSRRQTSYLIISLRVLSVIIALLFFYVSLFLYEDEQGQLQNRLEGWWIKTYDLQSVSLANHIRVLRNLGLKTGQMLDAVLGPKFFSLQSICVSSCFAFASANLYQYFFAFDSPLKNHVANAVYWLSFALVPALLRDRNYMWAWYVCLFYFIWLDSIYGSIIASSIAIAIDAPILLIGLLGLPVAIAIGCLFSFLSVTLIRLLLRKLSGAESWLAVAILLILIAVPGALFLTPYTLLPLLVFSDTDAGVLIGVTLFFSLLVINSYLLVPSLIFFALSCLLAAHKLIGGFLPRLIYAFQRTELIKRNKLIASVGILLLLFGLGVDTITIELIKKMFF